MYANGMSMRAISRVLNVPLGTVFTWIKRYGREKHQKLIELWAASMDFRFPWSSNEFTITRWLSTSFTPPTYLLDRG